MKNQGFDSQEIEALRKEIAATGQLFLVNEDEMNNEDFAFFYFIGKHEGKEVIFDAAMYTLKMYHSSKLYELAEEAAKEKYPDYEGWDLDLDEEKEPKPTTELDEEIENYKATVMMELEEEGDLQVQEHINYDESFDFGVGIEVCLNVEEITPSVINDFVKEYQEGSFKLDPALYSFVHDDSEED